MILGEKGTESTFLQIGSWVYPLVPGVSPCYRTNYGAFILPDLHSDIPGKFVIEHVNLLTKMNFCLYKIIKTLLIVICTFCFSTLVLRSYYD